jgi:enoyl-CoA hydratase/carnithine racemase
MAQVVLYEVAGHVATLTLNRPDRLNAITVEMLGELTDRLRQAEADPAVRCILLTGAGRGFCAGLDLVEAAGEAGRLESLAFDFDPQAAPVVVMQQIGTPVVAAVNGPAAGYGVGLALNADIRVMSMTARFVAPTTRGLVPESGDTYLLPRLVGWEHAARFYFLGDPLEADEALAAGVVSELAEDAAAARERGRVLAERVADMPPLAVQAAKRMMRAGRTDGYVEHVERVLRQLLPMFRTRDFGEAAAAFMEKRSPHFTGE